MLITINRGDFKSLDDASLIWTCIEPAMLQARGKNFAVKSEVYSHLTAGQQALFMFQMLYGHSSKGIEEFFSHLSYLLSNKGVWSQLKKGIQYFGDYDMVQILEKMEMAFGSSQQYNNAEMSLSMSDLNKLFIETLPLTVKRVATYIRNNEGDFALVVD